MASAGKELDPPTRSPIVNMKAVVNMMIAKRGIKGMANGSRTTAQRDAKRPNNLCKAGRELDRKS